MKNYIIWTMILCQLFSWGYFSVKGGHLRNKPFFLFTAGMMLGQLGAAIETYQTGSWATFTIQVCFFCFTALTGIMRYISGRTQL